MNTGLQDVKDRLALMESNAIAFLILERDAILSREESNTDTLILYHTDRILALRETIKCLEAG